MVWAKLEMNSSSDNLGQSTVGKVIKLSKIGFSMEYFTADFVRICNANVKNCILSGRLGTCC